MHRFFHTFKIGEGSPDGGRAGQAMVEFVVALVAILVLFAALVQFSRMGSAHTRTMMAARREAGLLALASAPSLSGPDYILDRTRGADGAKFSRDDGHIDAMAGVFSAQLVGYADPGDLNVRRPGNAISVLYNNPFPQLQFGLVRGFDTETITLLPVIRNLVYRSNTIDVEGEAWMTWTHDMY